MEGTDIVIDPNRLGNALRLINDYTGVADGPNITMVEVRACMTFIRACCVACRRTENWLSSLWV